MLINLSLKALTIILLVLCIFVFVANYYRKRKHSSVNIEALNKSLPAFKEYLDSYYITNKIYTIIAFVFFLFSTVIVFVVLRYLYLGELNTLLYIESKNISFSIIFYLILKYILFLLCILLYKVILEILFFKEVLKVHIYLNKYELYVKLQDVMDFEVNDYILKHLWILSYRIATLTYDPENFNKPFEEWFEQLIDSNEQSYHVTNYYMNSIALWCMDKCKKNSYLSHFFYLLACILKFLHWHNRNGVFKLLPYTFLLLTFFYDIYNRELYYIYHASFIFIILRLIISYRNFIRDSNTHANSIIANYFYKNSLPYEEQRFYILNYKTYLLEKTSLANQNLSFIKHDPLMLMNKLKKSPVIQDSDEKKLNQKRIKYMNIRFHVCLVLAVISFSFLSYNNIIIEYFLNIPLFFAIIPLLIMFYCMTKIFYREINEAFTGDEWYQYIYNKKYDMIFWIFTIIQIYIFWITFFGPQLIFVKDEILFDNIIKIIRIYTIEEKIMYLYQYFDYSVGKVTQITPDNIYHLTEAEREFLRYYLRKEDYASMINKTTSLKDIQEYIRSLYDNFFRLKNTIDNLSAKPSQYTVIKYIIIFIISTYALLSNIKVFLTAQELMDTNKSYLLGKKIINIFQETSQDTFLNNFYKFLGNIPKDLSDYFFYADLETVINSIIYFLIGIPVYKAFSNHMTVQNTFKVTMDTCITFLKDMSTIPIIASYNFYYFIGAIVIVILISISFIIRSRKESQEKKTKAKLDTENKSKSINNDE